MLSVQREKVEFYISFAFDTFFIIILSADFNLQR